MFIKPLSPVGAKELSGAAESKVEDAATALIEQAMAHAPVKGGARQAAAEELTGTMAGALAAIGKTGQAAGAAIKGIGGAPGRTVTVRSAAMPQVLGQPALRFLTLAGTEHLSRLYEYTLELRTADDTTVPLAVSANADVSALIGKDMTVVIQLDGSGTGLAGAIGAGDREISGMVVQAGFSRREGRYHVFQVTLRPWLWLATLTSDFKIFQDKSVVEIIDTVLADYPYPVEKRLEAGKYVASGESARNEPRAFQVQYGETDFDFIQRLMEEWGIYWFFEHSEGKHRLILCDHVGGHKDSPSDAYKTVAYRSQDSRIDTEYIREFRLSEGLRPGRIVLGDYDFTRPAADLLSVSQQPLEHSPNDAEIYLWPGDYTDSKHADLISRVRMEELRAAGARAKGAGNVRGLACGQTFTLSGHAHKAANQAYLLIEAYLSLKDIGEESGSGRKYECENRFLVQPATEMYRAPRDTPKPRTNGPQSAMVVGPEGKEIWTDEFGRVKVRFMWDRNARDNESDSCWVRVSQAWAGSGFGGMYIPRIGQEVVIEFMNGDPDRPLIIGSLYNSRTRPPWELPRNATQSGFMSRSMEGGPNNFNAMRFEDKKGAEHFMVQAEKDMGTTVKNNENHFVGANRTKTIGGNETVTVKGTRTETVTGDETVTLDANRAKKVALNETSDIGVDRTETVGGNETVTITGNRVATITGTKTETVSKKKSETVLQGKDETISKSKKLEIGYSYRLNVGMRRTTTVALGHWERIGKTQKTTIGVDHVMSIAGNQKFGVGGNQKISVAGTIVIDAGASIKLVCGASSIVMDKAGNIAITGVNITAGASKSVRVSGETISSSASGDHTVEGTVLKLNP